MNDLRDFTELLSDLRVDYVLEGGNLSVVGYLCLVGTNITELPDNLSVGGSLHLDPKNFSNIPYREGCGSSERIIFAATLGVTPCICAGCFKGTLTEFEEAVDVKYSGKEAENYKQAGRDCIKELEGIKEETKGE